MAARSRDAATENKNAVAPKHDRVTRGFRSEPRGFSPILVGHDSNAWNRSRPRPQIGVVPTGLSIFRLREQNVGVHFADGVRHDLRELTDARASERTMR